MQAFDSHRYWALDLADGHFDASCLDFDVAIN